MNYGNVIDGILASTGPAPLGPGSPVGGTGSLSLKSIFAHSQVKNKSFANCTLAGLYLRLHELDRSHDISNEVPAADGSYWHGLMHRREPDVHNSNYWFRRVGVHPVFPLLLDRVKGLEGGENNREINSLTGSGQWDPFKFNQLCDDSRGFGSDLEKLCIKIQEEEWHLLFEYCYVNSIGIEWDKDESKD